MQRTAFNTSGTILMSCAPVAGAFVNNGNAATSFANRNVWLTAGQDNTHPSERRNVETLETQMGSRVPSRLSGGADHVADMSPHMARSMAGTLSAMSSNLLSYDTKRRSRVNNAPPMVVALEQRRIGCGQSPAFFHGMSRFQQSIARLWERMGPKDAGASVPYPFLRTVLLSGYHYRYATTYEALRHVKCSGDDQDEIFAKHVFAQQLDSTTIMVYKLPTLKERLSADRQHGTGSRQRITEEDLSVIKKKLRMRIEALHNAKRAYERLSDRDVLCWGSGEHLKTCLLPPIMWKKPKDGDLSLKEQLMLLDVIGSNWRIQENMRAAYQKKLHCHVVKDEVFFRFLNMSSAEDVRHFMRMATRHQLEDGTLRSCFIFDVPTVEERRSCLNAVEKQVVKLKLMATVEALHRAGLVHGQIRGFNVACWGHGEEIGAFLLPPSSLTPSTKRDPPIAEEDIADLLDMWEEGGTSSLREQNT